MYISKNVLVEGSLFDLGIEFQYVMGEHVWKRSGKGVGWKGLEPGLYVPLKAICASKDNSFLVH